MPPPNRFLPERVHATSDGISGRTPEALKATYDMVSANNAHPSVLSALDVITYTAKSVIYRTRAQLLGEHRYLFGVTINSGVGRVDRPYDVLMVVQGSDSGENQEEAPYNKLEIARWSRNDLLPKDLGMTTLNFLLDKSLTDVENVEPIIGVWGVPVHRLTEVSFVDDGTSYFYGQQKDMEKIKGLDIPEPLKSRFKAEAADFHDHEIDALKYSRNKPLKISSLFMTLILKRLQK